MKYCVSTNFDPSFIFASAIKARNILNFIMDGGVFSEDVFKEMLGKKEISYHLMAKPEQLVDDLNGVLSPIQKRMIKELLGYTVTLEQTFA